MMRRERQEEVGSVGCVRLGRSREGLSCILSIAQNWKRHAVTYISQRSFWLLGRASCYGGAKVEVGSPGGNDGHVD